MRYEITFAARRTVQVHADTELEAVEQAYESLPEGLDWSLIDEYHEHWGGQYCRELHGDVVKRVGE